MQILYVSIVGNSLNTVTVNMWGMCNWNYSWHCSGSVRGTL